MDHTKDNRFHFLFDSTPISRGIAPRSERLVGESLRNSKRPVRIVIQSKATSEAFKLSVFHIDFGQAEFVSTTYCMHLACIKSFIDGPANFYLQVGFINIHTIKNM